MTDAIIRKSIYLAASPEKVWAYLTEADKLAAWFHPAKADLATGHYSLLDSQGEDLCWGEVLEANPPRRMVWTFTARPMGGLVTRVEWGLEAVNGGTRLDLTHTGLSDGEGFGLTAAFDAGWDRHFLTLREAVA
ncbi:MAG: SRPBCC domain-containing protein [Pseudomonadota bacterium]